MFIASMLLAFAASHAEPIPSTKPHLITYCATLMLLGSQEVTDDTRVEPVAVGKLDARFRAHRERLTARLPADELDRLRMLARPHDGPVYYAGFEGASARAEEAASLFAVTGRWAALARDVAARDGLTVILQADGADEVAAALWWLATESRDLELALDTRVVRTPASPDFDSLEDLHRRVRSVIEVGTDGRRPLLHAGLTVEVPASFEWILALAKSRGQLDNVPAVADAIEHARLNDLDQRDRRLLLLDQVLYRRPRSGRLTLWNAVRVRRLGR